MGENIDRISDLPDAILLKILSPFPMKFLIRTSVLSKRWKNLWKSNPNLDFDIDLWDPYLFVPEELRTNKKRTEFVSFIEQFLHCYEPGAKINRFRLFFFPDKCHRLQTTKWIQFALARGAEELDLNFFMMNQEMFKLSPFLFDHGSMSVLKLNYCDFSPPLSFKGLSSLKILVLRDLKITSDVIASVVCNCPLLESLTVKECYQLLELSIPSSGFRFKSLTVAGCLGLMKLEIYTPNLQSLHYSGKYIELFLENVSCLSDALFNIVLIKVNINPKDGCVEEVHHDPKPLLSEISHVKILTMSGWFVQFIFTVQHIFEHPTIVTMFHNLKELQLPMGEITKWDVLAISCFLQKCPWLEKLFIDIKTGDGAQQYASFWQSDYYGDYEPFDSVLGDLKMIKIKGFTGRKQEMRLVKYFLRKAVMLNLLILIPAQDYEGENTIEDVVRDLKVNLQLSGMRSLGDQLMLLQKASSGAKIVVYEYSEDHYEAYRPTHTEVYRPKSKDHF